MRGYVHARCTSPEGVTKGIRLRFEGKTNEELYICPRPLMEHRQRSEIDEPVLALVRKISVIEPH